MERFVERGLPPFMLTETWRAARGLFDINNKLVYGGKLIDYHSIFLVKRPRARVAVQYIGETWKVNEGIPHILFNVRNSVCVRASNMSRYNPMNVAICINIIKGLE